MKETHSLYIFKGNIYKHQNELEIGRYILLTISLISIFSSENTKNCQNIIFLKFFNSVENSNEIS